MADKELIDELLKQFKISLNNAAVYFKDHPLFKQSVSNTYRILEEVFFTLNPFSLGITADSLLVEDDLFKDERLYREIARHFHYRKVKKIVFFRGVTVEELSAFISIASKPFKELIKENGIKGWLTKENVSNIDVEELDYSELLGTAEGEERKDIWRFIIEKAYRKKRFSSEIKELAEHFEEVMSQFSSSDLVEDPSLISKIAEVIRYLKSEDIEKFKQCSKVLVKFVLDNGDSLDKEEIASEVRRFLREIEPHTLSDILWEYNFESKKFDTFALEVFSKFLDGSTQEAIATSLKKKFIANRHILNNREVRKKFEVLVASFENKFVSSVYMSTLSTLIKEMEMSGAIDFDPGEIFVNYLYFLLNALYLEEKHLKVELIVSRVMSNWDKILEVKDLVFVKNLIEVLDRKIRGSLDNRVVDVCEKAKNQINSSIEEIILDNISSMSGEDFDFFFSLISKSTLEPEMYIDKIMNEMSSRDRLIKLFNKFFPDKVGVLLKAIKESISTLGAAKQAVSILKYIGSAESLGIMKHIFNVGNAFIKIEVLKAMSGMEMIDEDFILKALRDKSVFIKKEALGVIILKAPHLKEKAVDALLNIFNPLGIRNNILADNIRMIGEENIKEARQKLIAIDKRFYLFGSRVLKEAVRKALEDLNKSE